MEVVPRLAPATIHTATDGSRMPCDAATTAKPLTTELDCTKAVSSAPNSSAITGDCSSGCQAARQIRTY